MLSMVLTALLVLTTHTGPIQAVPVQESAHDCSVLVGTWKGEHRFPDGSFSAWEVINGSDGQFWATFFDEEGEQTETQTGRWGCDGEHFATQTTNQEGQPQTFAYRILQLDKSTVVYQFLSADGNGPVFTSTKASGELISL